MQTNGVNYYKGVLLCSRPNQSPSVNKQKPFCGRVFPKQQIGLVPTKQYDQHKTFKRNLPVLSNHKKWLEKFKKQVKDKQEQERLQKQKQTKHLQKIKLQGQKQRQKLKITNNQNQSGSEKVLQQKQESQIDNKQIKNTAKQIENPHKKKPNKPAWALTQKQAQQKQTQQIDQLINFFQQGQVQEVKDYVTDEGIKKILNDLKIKIQQMKNQSDQWKKNQINRIRQSRQNQQTKDHNQKDDILSKISKNSGSQSVTSQKTAERVEQLQKKKQQQKDWEKLTTSQKTGASVDEQIAKNIADEILRNYPNLKHHSNQSIRKLLQKQARDQLKA